MEGRGEIKKEWSREGGMEKDESGKREKEPAREQEESVKQRRRWKDVFYPVRGSMGSFWEH